jgi:hypothetical protein
MPSQAAQGQRPDCRRLDADTHSSMLEVIQKRRESQAAPSLDRTTPADAQESRCGPPRACFPSMRAASPRRQTFHPGLPGPERRTCLRVLLHEVLVELLKLVHKRAHDLLARQDGGAQMESVVLLNWEKDVPRRASGLRCTAAVSNVVRA